MLGLSSSELGATTTTNIGSMFRRTKFTAYYSLCCANGTPVETAPSMNFGLFAKGRNQTRVWLLAIAVQDIHTDSASGPTTIRAGFSLLHFRTRPLRPKCFIPEAEAGTRTRRGLARVSFEIGRLPQLWQQRTNIWRRVTIQHSARSDQQA